MRKPGILFPAILAFAATLALAAPDYPSRPIRLIVPFPAGGTGDGVARQFQPELAKSFGQPIVIENKSGASGRLGAAEVAKAAPDGYTIMMVYDSYAIDPIVYKDLPYDQWKELTPVTLMVRAPLVAVASSELVPNDIPELIAYAKANPGKVEFGSTGVGSSNHLAGELFAQMTGTRMTHIPYKGGAPAQADLMGGRLKLFWATYSFANRVVPSGKAKVLGVASSKRLASQPNLKTVREQGGPAFEAQAWIGLVAPAGTPREIIDRWRAEVTKAAASPSVTAWLEKNSFEAVNATPEEFGAFLRAEHAKWGELIRKAGISLQ